MSTTGTTPDQSVIDRVRKLLALASNNTNPNEAAAAAARAQELLFKHKLAMADVAAATGVDEPKVGEINFDVAGEFLLAWRSILLNVVSRHCMCRPILCPVIEATTGRKAVRLKIIGLEDDANVALYLYMYLTAEIERLASSATVKGFKAKNAFRRGAVHAIHARLETQRAAQVSANGERALAVIKNSTAAADAYVDKIFPSKALKKTSASEVTDARAYGEGLKAGRDIAIPGKDARKGIGAPAKRIASGN